MRRLKNKILLVLAVFPLLIYALSVFRTGELISFYDAVTPVLGDYGAFFEPAVTALLTNFVELANAAGVQLICWLIGYYTILLFAYILYSLFTFLITFFMDKIDKMKGN